MPCCSALGMMSIRTPKVYDTYILSAIHFLLRPCGTYEALTKPAALDVPITKVFGTSRRRACQLVFYDP